MAALTVWVIPLGHHEIDRDCPECFRTLTRCSFTIEGPRSPWCPSNVRFFDLCPEHGEVPSCSAT